ncbi:MAG: response regulator transcription factor [Actinomycetota bacterium]|nr:response regulator transcription factor [Actinomycetota bacterium]
MTITVLLVDDQALLRTGFRMILEAHKDITVVGEAADGREAVHMAARLRPDVILMDIRMPHQDGVEATRQLTAAGTTSRVLILTTFDVDEYAFSGLRAGASGFLLKDVPPDQLIAAVRTIASGDAVVSPRITRQLLNRYARQLPDRDNGSTSRLPPALERLTDRERQVLLHIAAGQSNAEIGAALHVAEATVKTHVTRLLAKLELRDRVQAVVFAYEAGLIIADNQEHH